MTQQEPRQQANDQHLRDQAIDANTSYIVEAPAGSGKTELLVTRYVTLLSQVRYPEQILAITFTVKAASEMKNRVLLALASEQVTDKSTVAVSPQLQRAAQLATRQDAKEQWHLLNNPSRLKIMTIDSLNMQLARKAAIHRGGYGQENVSTNDNLYRQAANALLATLQHTSKEETPLERVFFHYGCDGKRLESSIIHMLQKREQWLDLLVELRASDSTALHSLLNSQLEKQAEYASQRHYQALASHIPTITNLAAFARSNLLAGNPLSPALNLLEKGYPEQLTNQLDYWQALQLWLLTAGKVLRKRVDTKMGFPAKAKGIGFDEQKQHMLDLIEALKKACLETTLQETLPPASYSNQQIQILVDFADVLTQASAWLQLIHNENNSTDYSGISQRALQAIGSDESPALLAEQAYDRIHHVLIDEFQDTSNQQYELLRRLVRDWSSDSSEHSLFIVGDPKQSIYRFRQAQPGLFHMVREKGIEQLRLHPLELQSNFRSNRSLIDWYNNCFARIFPQHPDYSIGETNYKPSIAERPLLDIEAVRFFIADASCAEQHILDRLVAELQTLQKRDDINSIAVLARSRKQALKVIRELKRQSMDYCAIGLEQLNEKQHIIDLLSLTKAISNEHDAISWLALLRHPAIAMSLQDLLYLNSNQQQSLWQAIQSPDERISAQGKKQTQHMRNILTPIIALAWRTPWRLLIEDSWHALGIAGVLTAEEKKQAEQVLALITKHSQGTTINFSALNDSLDKERYSENQQQQQSKPLYIMTIHKSKGLEFDAVFLPSLEDSLSGKGAQSVPPLLWDTLVNEAGSALILAPYKARQEQEKSRLYRYLELLEQRKNTAENQRLLYVACTRAQVCLRLFARINLEKKDEPKNNFAAWLLQAGVPFEQVQAVASDVEQENTATCVPVLTSYPLPERSTAATNQQEIQQESPQQLQQATYAAQQGTEIHHLIDTISRQHKLATHLADQQSRRAFIAEQQPQWFDSLRWRGISIDCRQQLAETSLLAITNIINDDIGRWLLTRQQADNEWAIQSKDDNGNIITRIIDRTFIDKGVRWIIDYKTMVRLEDESDKALQERAYSHYQTQLEQYAAMLYKKDKQPIRLGVYLLLQPLWIEWPWTPIE